MSPIMRRVLTLALPLLVAAALCAAPAWSWWTDDVAVSGTTITAGTLQPPTGVTCTNQLAQNPRISWTAPTSGPNKGNYRLIISGGALVNGATLTQDATGATSVTFNSGLLSAAGTYTVTVVTVWEQWASAVSTSSVNVTIGVAIGGLGLAGCS